MIRLATHSDLDRIMVIVNEVIKEMHVRGSQQWSTDYPKRADFIQDINKRELYVYEQAGEVAGMCAFSETGHAEYSLIPFSTTNALTIKRLAISPRYRNKGISHQFIEAIKRVADEKNKQAINGDTFKNNPDAQAFFLKHDFCFIAERPDDEGDVPLYYYELTLK
ncbi:hypothetical protein HMI01_10270 [Halolactibacillus miurensis]|uniref:N-acetylglutamate synthase, GNAT family n=1 Tax=Halolactibacillus miurensis TaxID=306541 RepID=A0A1I6SK67_9BACI|nr:GNAT family N-acetyltransferase [Halolactibacillus miurensis]GEM04039.1 hypothetical protein HMI01_10270 [Halolactibacillus miurensis]SFS77341.1 N-acetylglutamate synthase, GNAT family [Halolactibacillus miurensis]